MENNLRKLQLLELDILKQIIDLCDHNGLTYYAIGGTLLGAVRHKGFIPWDDDIDIGMPRPDYEKFLSIAQKALRSPYSVKTFYTSPEYKYQFAQVDTNQVQLLIDSTNRKKMQNIWVDIFPIDAMPNSKTLYHLHTIRLLFLRMMSKYSVFNDVVGQHQKNRPLYEKILIQIGNMIKPDRFMNYMKWYTRLDRAYKMYPYPSAQFIGNLCGIYKMHEIVPKSYFEPYRLLDFEGITIKVPNQYDAYLRHIYGDYRILPPENHRQQHFSGIIQYHSEKS